MSELDQFITDKFNGDYLEGLKEFIRIPSLSPKFDPQWQENGHLDKQAQHLVNYIKAQDLKGVDIQVIRDKDRTPFLLVKIDAFNTASEECVLIYGHMDKQPFGEGWTTDPCDPVIKDGRMYGRGSHDDGYCLFSAILAVKAAQALGKSHPKMVITIEGSEEGDVADLLHYLRTYKHLLDNPTLVICLDTGAVTEKTLTLTTSLRGAMTFDLKASVAHTHIHSGVAGGIFPNPYMILNNLLSRIHNFETQKDIEDFAVEVPAHREQEIQILSHVMGSGLASQLPFLEGVKSLGHAGNEENPVQELASNLRRNFWGSALTVIGIQGLPSDVSKAGNVVYKELLFRCSLRIPPTQDCEKVIEILKTKLTSPGPDTFGAKIELTIVDQFNGFDCPKLPEKYTNALGQSTQEVFGQGALPLNMGLGASVPFMEAFKQEFPNTNFILTGVGFPDGFAHAANENIRLDFTRKLTIALSAFLQKL